MVNYQSAKIYKITGGGFTYIGSTTTSLSRRLAHHRNDLKSFKEGRHYKGFVKREKGKSFP